jgi:hypothetical protein
MSHTDWQPSSALIAMRSSESLIMKSSLRSRSRLIRARIRALGIGAVDAAFAVRVARQFRHR